MKKFILSLIILFSLSACTSNNGHYAAISNKPMNLFTLTNEKTVVARDVKATSSRSIFILLPFDDQPSVEEAVDMLLGQHMGDYVANAEITHTAFHVVWLFHYSAWSVRGDVVRVY